MIERFHINFLSVSPVLLNTVELYLQSNVVILSQPPHHRHILSCWKICCHQPRAREAKYHPKTAFYNSCLQLIELLIVEWWPGWKPRYHWFHDFTSPQRMERWLKKKTQNLFTWFCRTTTRPQTFYDGSRSCSRGVCHIPMAEPFCPKTREVCNLSGRCMKISHKGLGWHLDLD